MPTTDRLLTGRFCCMMGANFLMFMGFYLLLPIFPFYLSESFGASNSTIGSALSCYTIAAMFVRPFSGYLLDSFARKPLYLLSYFLFMAVFAGYLVAGSVLMFAVFRVIHGLAFGTVTVAGNTIVIDIMPSSRRGEGLGYYGLANNIAMSVGPMLGIMLHDAHVSFNVIFVCSFCSCLLGLLLASTVSTPVKPPVVRPPVSLDRFLLVRGIPAGVSLLMLSLPYGVTSSYIAMYARQMGITLSSGLFFSCLALGIASSRFLSGRLVDRGYMLPIIRWSIVMAGLVFLCLGLCRPLSEVSVGWATRLFFGRALMMGVSYGTMFPAFKSLFVSLAPNNRRGTAVSTYLIAWDLGIGCGLLVGGVVSELAGFDVAYYLGAALAVVSLGVFVAFVCRRQGRLLSADRVE